MKQIYRSTKDKMIGGVASGMAHYLDLDIALIRLLWVLFAFMGGIGFPVYLVAWIIIPEEPYPGASKTSISTGVDDNVNFGEDTPEKPNEETETYVSPEIYSQRADRTNQVLGILLVVIGAAFLIRETLHLDIFRYVWPVLLVILGVYILVNDKRGA